jgi:NADH-quinone oxidoreductase subunit F
MANKTPDNGHFLLRDLDTPDIRELDVYVGQGGYRALQQVVKAGKPDQVIDEVRRSKLRGRGGAGFPTGVKWSFVPADVFPKYVVVNADESEPGTFKDRQLLEGNPHQVIEGAAIAAFAIQAQTVYVYCRGEFYQPTQVLQQAIDDAYAAGYLGKSLFGSDYSLDMTVHLGAGAYICGEETALLESLEGHLGQPRLRPPFPANKGLYGKPTVINNVETLANVPIVTLIGAERYARLGSPDSPGPKIFCVSGHVERPGNYEGILGEITFRDLVFERAGGIPGGHAIKAILPAGASAPMLPATDEVLDTALDYESLIPLGSSLGSASVIVLDETVDIFQAAHQMIRFFKHESCGKCTPCREGTHWMLRIFDRIADGRGGTADIITLESVAHQIQGKCLCALGEFSIQPVLSTLKHFRHEYETHVNGND